MPPFTPQLDPRLRAEFLDHSLHLLPIAPQVDWARLLTDAWAFRLEPPRDLDLPTLPEKAYPMIDPGRAEQLQQALQPPPPLGDPLRQAERDQVIGALLNGSPVLIRAEAGAESDLLLTQIAADGRVRGRFRRIWWFDQADSIDAIGAAVGVALMLPHVLKAAPVDRPRLAREYLDAAAILLVIASVPDKTVVSDLLDFGAGLLIVTEAESADGGADDSANDRDPAPFTFRLGGLNTSDAAQLAGFADPPAAAERALIDRVGGNARALTLIRGLMAHDGLTLDEIDGLLSPEHDPLADLLAASYAALPADYQAIGGWFQDDRPVALEAFMARFPTLPVAKRTLRFLLDRGFVRTEGDTVCAIGWPPDSLFNPERDTQSDGDGQNTPPLTPIRLPIGEVSMPDPDTLPADDPRRAARTAYREGIAAIEARKDDDAEALLTEALLIRQKHDQPHAVAEVEVALGRLAYLRDDMPDAIRHLEAAAGLIHGLRDTEALDVVRVALSRVYRQAGKYDAALSLLDDEAPATDLFTVYALRGEWSEALIAAARHPNPRDRRREMAYAQLGAGQLADALQVMAGHDDYEAWLVRAIVAHLQADWSHALAAYERADAAAGPTADRGTLARGWACALASAGRFAEAEVQVSAAAVWYESRLGRRLFARQSISHALHAAFALALQDFETAAKAARRALDCPGERIDPQARAIAWHVLGRIAAEGSTGQLDPLRDPQPDPQAALLAYQSALQERESIQPRDEATIGLTLRAIADCYAALGEPERAIANDRRALTHLDESREAAARLHTLLSLRIALEGASRPADALSIGSQLIACAAQVETDRPLDDLHILGYALTSQAAALIDAGRPAQADQTLNVWLSRLADQLDSIVTGDDPALQVLGSGLLARSVLSGAPGTLNVSPNFLRDLAEEAVQVAEAHWPDTPIAWAARRDLAELLLREGAAGEALAALSPIDRSAVAEMAPLSALRMAITIGRAALVDNQLPLAIEAFQQAIALEPDQVVRGGFARELAGAYAAAGDPHNAAMLYRTALGLFDVNSARAEHVSTLIDLGYVRLGMAQFAEAIETFESALTIVESFSDQALMARVLTDLANAHYTLGQYRRAAVVYQRALDFQGSGDPAIARAGTLVALAETYSALGEHRQALSAYHDALHSGPSPLIRQRAQLGIATAQVALKQPRPAIDAYNAALRLDTLTAADRSTIERGLGQQYTALGQHDAARQHFEKALQALPDADGQKGLTLRAIADGYLAQGQLPEAITVFRQALDDLDRTHFPHDRAAVLRTLGDLLLRTGQYDDGLHSYESALEIERALPKKDGGRIVATLRGLAAAHEKMGTVDQAILAHHQALVYQDARHAPDQYTQTLLALGRLYVQVRRYGEAAKALEDALATEYGQPTPDSQVITQAIAALGDVYRLQGKAIRAAELYRQVAVPAAPIPGAAGASAIGANDHNASGTTHLGTPAGTDPIRARAAQSLGEVEAEINRYRQMLQAVDQSWALLHRDRVPDLKALALLRALQAQIHAALGETERSNQRIDELVALLDPHFAELDRSASGAAQSPELYALALWLDAFHHDLKDDQAGADRLHDEALAFAESNHLAPELIWLIRAQTDSAH